MSGDRAVQAMRGLLETVREALEIRDVKIAALEADAERYRWLRSGERLRQGVRVGGARVIARDNVGNIMELGFWCSPEELDAAIDKARQQK